MLKILFVVIWILSSLSVLLFFLAALSKLEREEPVEVMVWLLWNLLSPACAFGVALLLYQA
jgi:hypothetical protein